MRKKNNPTYEENGLHDRRLGHQRMIAPIFTRREMNDFVLFQGVRPA